MGMRVVGLALALGALAPSCATVVEGSDQQVLVRTDPAGAACELTRNGGTIAVVRQTPGTATIEKSSDAVQVECALDGFEPSTVILTSEFADATFGNILLGGVIGIAIDAASGATSKYPEQITVTLAPKAFDSEEERDAFYAYETVRVNSQAEAATTQLRAGCPADQTARCDAAIAKVEANRSAAVAKLEAERLSAQVTPPAPDPTVAALIAPSRPAAEPVETGLFLDIAVSSTQFSQDCRIKVAEEDGPVIFKDTIECGDILVDLDLKVDETGRVYDSGAHFDMGFGSTALHTLRGNDWRFYGRSSYAKIRINRS